MNPLTSVGLKKEHQKKKRSLWSFSQMIVEVADLVIQFFLVFQKTAFEFAEDLVVL
jgi:hypothetical protein